jgi:hypothetical protein
LQFLVSPVIASRIYNNQMDDLIAHYFNYCDSSMGWLALENFAPLARELLLMIYQNTYTSEVNLATQKHGIVHLIQVCVHHKFLNEFSFFMCIK